MVPCSHAHSLICVVYICQNNSEQDNWNKEQSTFCCNTCEQLVFVGSDPRQNIRILKYYFSLESIRASKILSAASD